MFELKWLTSGVKNLFYWISGAAFLTFAYKFLNTYLKNRAVRKSEVRGDHDRDALQRVSKDTEKSWVDQGVITDKEKDKS